MRFNHLAIVYSFFILFSSSLLADAINFNLNDRAFFVEYSHLPDESNAVFSGSLLHHADNGDLISARFHIEQNLYDVNKNIIAGIGAKAVAIDANGFDGGALALSAYLKYKIPQNNKLSIASAFDYAPEVVSFIDLEGFFKAEFTIKYQLIDHASAYIGARSVRLDATANNKSTFESGAFFGISIDI
ncbi:MAG: hypothetical protein JKX83_01630 [Pseudomonadales bacterium]|nr:hypothetical protein [Pseudomonadales bacterium]